MNNRITATHILQALDAAAEKGDFPAFDNLNVDYAASRLVAYRAETDWAIVFNSIVWMDEDISTFIEPIGSGIAIRASAQPKNPFEGIAQTPEDDAPKTFSVAMKAMQALRLALPRLKTDMQRSMQELQAAGSSGDNRFVRSGHIAIDYDDDDEPQLRSVSVRGKKIALSKLAIESDPDLHPDLGFWATVAVAGQHHDALFASESELAQIFSSGLPLPLLVLDN